MYFQILELIKIKYIPCLCVHECGHVCMLCAICLSGLGCSMFKVFVFQVSSEDISCTVSVCTSMWLCLYCVCYINLTCLHCCQHVFFEHLFN